MEKREELGHNCKEKCKLCDSICAHVYNHQNDFNLVCQFCKQYGHPNCKIKNGHLCGRTHICKKMCDEKGVCDILPQISFEGNLRKFKQKMNRLYCCKIIPINEFNHSGSHKCLKFHHYCGFKCPQCENYCTDLYDINQENGHSVSHVMQHGNIVNSFQKNINSSNDIIVKKEYEHYKLTDKESPIIFTCTDYCDNKGRGHTHLVLKSTIDNNITKKNDERIRKFDNNYYECKCSYFWENILKMDNGFYSERKKKFDLCDCICPCKEHDPRSNELNYCIRELWHGKDIPNELKGYTASPEGHIFKCDHPKNFHS